MQYRQLGNSGLAVSPLTLGTMTFGTGSRFGLKLTFDQGAANNLISKALEAGINFFDTADIYSVGQSEPILGEALKGKRTTAIISSKVYFRTGEPITEVGLNAKHLIQQCEASLKKLQTDYLDVLLVHNDDPLTPLEETARALENLVQRGLVRYPGFSNFSAWKAATLIGLQKQNQYAPMVASQMHYSLLNRDLENEFVPMSLHHKVGMMVWSPLSGGFLTGKYTRENPKPTEGRLNTDPFALHFFDQENAYTVVDKLKELAKKHNTSPTAISLAWLLTKPAVSTVIIGVSRLEQLDSNLEGARLALPAEDLAALDALTKPALRYPVSFNEKTQDVPQKNVKPFC